MDRARVMPRFPAVLVPRAQEDPLAENRPLEGLLDDLAEANASGGVKVGELIGTFEDRPAGVLITLFAMLALIPFIGGLPGAPIVISLLILYALGKSLFGGKGLWVPAFVARREISNIRLEKGIDVTRPWARRIDRLTTKRLSFLVAPGPARFAVLGVVAILAIGLVPLGLIPAGITPAALGLLVFGLALTARDGLFALAGYALTAVATFLTFRLL
jgi:hypothetical protein